MRAIRLRRKFEFVEHESVKDWQCIRIRKGPFSGLVYCYGRVGVVEQPEGAKLEFSFDMVENPRDVDLDSKRLHKLMGDILVFLLDEQLNGGEIVSDHFTAEEVEKIPEVEEFDDG